MHHSHLYTHVRFVDAADLPEGHKWMIVRDGELLAAFIDRDCITERTLQDAWDGARVAWQSDDRLYPVLPRQRDTGLPYAPDGYYTPPPSLRVVGS